jgi:hypothetical protein
MPWSGRSARGRYVASDADTRQKRSYDKVSASHPHRVSCGSLQPKRVHDRVAAGVAASSLPWDQGLDAALLDKILQRLVSEEHGYVHRFLLIQNGDVVIDQSYEHNYELINAGRDPTLHPYNVGLPPFSR